ncbi:hypothetical protein HDU96_007204 [Phlyctochytrium bullatum]|nr:hypothetical protein HDU96_007204 [Phlyctochytrium bullatum]
MERNPIAGYGLITSYGGHITALDTTLWDSRCQGTIDGSRGCAVTRIEIAQQICNDRPDCGAFVCWDRQGMQSTGFGLEADWHFHCYIFPEPLPLKYGVEQMTYVKVGRTITDGDDPSRIRHTPFPSAGSLILGSTTSPFQTPGQAPPANVPPPPPPPAPAPSQQSVAVPSQAPSPQPVAIPSQPSPAPASAPQPSPAPQANPAQNPAAPTLPSPTAGPGAVPAPGAPPASPSPGGSGPAAAVAAAATGSTSSLSPVSAPSPVTMTVSGTTIVTVLSPIATTTIVRDPSDALAIPVPAEARRPVLSSVSTTTSALGSNGTPMPEAISNVTAANDTSGGSSGSTSPLDNPAVIAAVVCAVAAALLLGVVVAAMLFHNRRRRKQAAALETSPIPAPITREEKVSPPPSMPPPAANMVTGPSRVSTTTSTVTSVSSTAPPSEKTGTLFPLFPPPGAHLPDAKLGESHGIFEGVDPRGGDSEQFESRTAAGAVIKANAAARERVRGMGCAEIRQRLMEVGLAEGLVRVLEGNGIDGPRLLDLDALHLESMGISSRASRTLILQTVEIMLEHVRDGLMGGDAGVGASGPGWGNASEDDVEAPPHYHGVKNTSPTQATDVSHAFSQAFKKADAPGGQQVREHDRHADQGGSRGREGGRQLRTPERRFLETAIELRDEVMSKYKSDEGHGYFLKPLKDVRKMLLPLTKTDDGKTKGKRKEEAKKEETLVNQFSVLSVDTDETEEPVEEEEPDAVERRLQWEKKKIVIEVDTEWFVIICFLYDASELVEEVIDSWSEYKKGTVPILVPTAATNLAVKLFTKLMNKLHLDYPHLQLWDHFVTALAFDELLQSILSACPRVEYGRAYTAKTNARLRMKETQKMIDVLKSHGISMSDAQLEDLSFKISAREQEVRKTPAYMDGFGILEPIILTQYVVMNVIHIPIAGEDLRQVLVGKPPWDEKSNPARNFSDLYTEYVYTVLLVLASSQKQRIRALKTNTKSSPISI